MVAAAVEEAVAAEEAAVAVAVVGVAVVAAAEVAYPFLEVACPMDHQGAACHHIRRHRTQENLEEASRMVEALQNGEEAARQRVACQGVVLASFQEAAALCWAFHRLQKTQHE